MALLSRTTIEAVIFDLDGTFYSHQAVKRAMIRALFPHILRLKRYNDARRATAGCDFGTAAGLREEQILLAAKGRARTARRLAAWLKKKYYPALFRCIAALPVRDGFPELLQALHAAGLRLAVVSDYGGVAERLTGLGIDPGLFTLLLGTEDEGLMKPAPRITTLALEALRSTPDRTLVVGDRADSDQALAAAAGMPFAGVCDGGCAPGMGEEWHSWAALKALLQSSLLK